MSTVFCYTARTWSGELVEGEMAAAEEKNVADYLRGQNYVVISITKKPGLFWDKNILATLKKKPSLPFHRKVRAKDLGFFCRQLATMLDSGVSLMSSLNILYQQKGVANLKKAIGRLIAELEQGSSIAEGSRKSPKVFPPVFVNIVEAGEVAGALDEVLLRLANHFDKEHELNEKVKTALTYPIIIIIVAVACLSFLLGYVLPQFTDLLTSLNVSLPLLTRLVIGTSHMFARLWYVLAAVFGVGFFIAYRKLQDEKNRLLLDSWVLRAPILGEIVTKREISRFARTMATLLRSGVSILRSLEVAQKVTSNLLFRNTWSDAYQNVRDGQGLAEPLQKSPVIPDMVAQMVKTGEETGRVEDMLEKLAVFYDREVDTVVSRMSSLIEPVFIVTLGGIIGVVLISILLPIFKVVTSVE